MSVIQAMNWWIKKDQVPDFDQTVFALRYRLARDYARGHVIDAACGFGYGSQLLAPRASTVLGLDVDPDKIEEATMRNPAPVFINYKVADLQTVTIPSCDWVVSLETVEHLREHHPFIRSAQAAARVGIVLSTPIVPVAHRVGHHHDFTIGEIQGWFERWTQVRGVVIQTPKNGGMQDTYYLGVWTR